jgi:TctA family transporter
VNQRRYLHSSRVGSDYTLAERYQLAENIRSGAIIRRSVIVVTVGGVVGTIVSLLLSPPFTD